MACTIPSEKRVANKPWTESDREFLVNGLEQSLDAVLQSVDQLTEEQWSWQVDSNPWSVGLIVEHLITHDELFYLCARRSHSPRIRSALIDFVKSTEADLRAYYTQSGRGPTAYRDLHQLLLISIAHTLRHHQQIENTLVNPRISKKIIRNFEQLPE